MSTASRPAALSVRELRVTLPLNGRQCAVVDRIGFDLAPGEIVGLVGESGSGKTLAASALLGMVPAGGRMDAASLRMGDHDLLALGERGWRRLRGNRIAMVFQEPLSALDPVFTVGQQITAVLRRHRGLRRREAQRRASVLLGSVGLAEPERLLNRYPHELSGGMRQRVLIAMALSCEPQVLVADEPTTALDAVTTAQVLELLRYSARATRAAVLLVTHDLGAAQRVCDRLLVMYAGRIAEEGPVRDLLQHPEHPYTAGLLAAMPRVTRGTPEPVRPMPGQAPAPACVPPGCAFSERCTRADQRCRAEMPALVPAAAGTAHRHACHHPLAGEAL